MKSEVVENGEVPFEIDGTRYEVVYQVEDCNTKRSEVSAKLYRINEHRFWTTRTEIDSVWRFVEKDGDRSLEVWVRVLVKHLCYEAQEREKALDTEIQLEVEVS